MQSNGQIIDPTAQEKFPFDTNFQRKLLKLLCEDDSFAHTVNKFLRPEYFENEILAWSYDASLRYREQYRSMPSLDVLMQETKDLEGQLRPIYQATLEQVRAESLKDSNWIRDKVLSFIKHNVFAKAFKETRDLYNKGRQDDCYPHMMSACEDILKIRWDGADREFFFENLPYREDARLSAGIHDDPIPTGIEFVDHVLNRGLSPGELGLWIAYPKCGKTSMLVNLGVNATRSAHRRTLHIVLEGSRQQVADRYDAAFSGELYKNIRSDGITSKRYTQLMKEYKMMSDLLCIRGCTEGWDYSVLDIDNELTELKQERNWKPDLIIVDYGDLLKGRDKSYRSETEKQRAAFRDLKSLANKGYAVWTASQAQRPRDSIDENKKELLRSKNIADCYDKVRVADFIGSLNMTSEERAASEMRIYAELYRDNAADQHSWVRADFSRMRIENDAELVKKKEAERQAESQANTPTKTTTVKQRGNGAFLN